MERKYELVLADKIYFLGRTLYRIIARKNFITCTGAKIKIGDLGGYIEKEENLSQYDNCWVCGNAKVWGNAEITKANHILIAGPIGSRNDITTFYRGKDNLIYVDCGCFNGTVDKFLEAVAKTHGDSKHAVVYRKAVELAKLQIEDVEND